MQMDPNTCTYQDGVYFLISNFVLEEDMHLQFKPIFFKEIAY